MRAYSIFRSALNVLVALILILGTAAMVLVYKGGYWENWSAFSHISGHMRFKQFVANPIPHDIYNIHGGYSGFPQGEITTYFHFNGDIKSDPLLKDWQELSNYDSSAPFVPYLLVLGATHVYMRSESEGYRYLLIADDRKLGMLYIP